MRRSDRAVIASLAINVGLYDNMTYDPTRDLTPIMRTVDVNYMLIVNPSLPVHSVGELIDYAKANPGKLTYGSAGSGSLPHLSMDKGGGPMVTDLLGNTVQLVIADQASLTPHIKAGRLRAIAVASPKRFPCRPDLPTIAEAGVPGFQAVAWERAGGACRIASRRRANDPRCLRQDYGAARSP